MRARVAAVLRLMRAHSALGAALLVPLGGALAGANGWDGRWIPPALLAFVLAAWGNVDNDIHDVAIDRFNRPTRPLPSGALTVATARRVAATLAGVALGLGVWLGWVALTGTLAALALTAAYTRELKGRGVLGPALVGMLTMWPLAFGGLLAGDLARVWPVGAVVGALFAAREVVKTVHDRAGDAAAGVGTLAVRWGNRRALACAAVWLGVALGVAWATPFIRVVGSLAVLCMAAVFAPVWRAPLSVGTVARALAWSKVVGLLLVVGLLVWWR